MLLKITEKIIQKNVFLTKEKETRVKRWSAFEQLRPAEHLLRQQNKKFFLHARSTLANVSSNKKNLTQTIRYHADH